MTQMSMGSNIALPATNVRASLRWTGGPGIPDVDVSALLLDEDGEVASDADFVFYNQPNHYSGGVRIAGKTPPPQASDSIDVDVTKVPPDTDRIVLAASADGGPFGQVPDLQMVLSDLATGQPVAYFPMQASSETAIVGAELYRRGGAWKFRAVGQGYASGLAGLAADFGIDTGHADSSGSAAPESRAAAAPAEPAPVAPPAPAAPPPNPEPRPPPAAQPPAAAPAPPAPTPPPAYPEPTPPPTAPPPADYPPAPAGFAPASPAGYAPSDASGVPPTVTVPAPPQGYPAPESFGPPAPYPPPEGYPPPTLDPPAGEEGGFSAPTLVEPSPGGPPPVQDLAPPAQPMAPPAQPMAPPTPEMQPPAMPAPVQQTAPPTMPAPQQPPAAPPPSAGGVNLQKNQKVELRPSGSAPLTRIVFSLGWQPPEGHGTVDMDASVIAFDATGEKLAIVWYMHLNEFAGALQHTGDNRTGGYGDVEQIMVDLVRMPANVNSLIFTINCFRGGTFTDIANAFCAVQNVDDGEELVRYDLADTQPSTALLIAELRRSAGGMWQMRAIGEFHDFRTVKKLLPAAARQATMA